MAGVVLDHRSASLVGAALAIAILLSYLRTVAYHYVVLTYGNDPEYLARVATDAGLHPHLGFDIRTVLLGTLAVVFVTRAAHLFQPEVRSVARRLARPIDAWRRHRVSAFVVEAVLTLFAVAVSFTNFDAGAAVLTTALAAAVLWRLAGHTPARTPSGFLLEFTSSLGAFGGVLIVGWRCAGKWLYTGVENPFAQAYRRLELFGFWYKDAPLLALILVLAALYMAYLEHGIASPRGQVAAGARRHFPTILVSVVAITVAVVGLDFGYVASNGPEFTMRCQQLARASGVASDVLCDAMRSSATRMVHERDVPLLMGGVVALALFYGILCYGASLVMEQSRRSRKT